MKLEQQAFECITLLIEAHVLLIIDQDIFGGRANLTMYLLCHENNINFNIKKGFDDALNLCFEYTYAAALCLAR